MKRLGSLLFIFSLLSFEVIANERIAKDQHAKEALAKLHFFRKGRGMVISPDAIDMFTYFGRFLGLPGTDNKDVKSMGVSAFKERWGLNIIDNKIKGFHHERYKKMDVGVMGCAVCHTGKAAGQYIIGLGNKNIDVGQMAKDVKRGTKLWQTFTFWKPKSPEYKQLEKDALGFATRLSNDKYNNLTQGLVPISMIQWWVYLSNGEDLPRHNHRGGVKVPHFWGYGKKRFIGQFSDGFGDGSLAGWGLAVELAATQSVENVRAQMSKIEHAEDLLHDILPPAYPFKVDQDKARRGKTIYMQACMKCHGTYERDAAGIPIFKEPKHIAIEVVKTDDDRLASVTPFFKSRVATAPLYDYMKYTDLPPGFFAPRLEAVWARFPYLHNASVPSLMALLTKPSERPTFWSLEDAGERHRYNETTMGLTLPRKGTREYRDLQKRANEGARNVYSTKRIGQSSKGHWFPANERMSHNDKLDLIEYLKTL